MLVIVHGPDILFSVLAKREAELTGCARVHGLSKAPISTEGVSRMSAKDVDRSARMRYGLRYLSSRVVRRTRHSASSSATYRSRNRTRSCSGIGRRCAAGAGRFENALNLILCLDRTWVVGSLNADADKHGPRRLQNRPPQIVQVGSAPIGGRQPVSPPGSTKPWRRSQSPLWSAYGAWCPGMEWKQPAFRP